VTDAMTKTAWTPKALHFLVLVANAPSHALGTPWNASGQDENTLRYLATDNGIWIAALHTRESDPRLDSLHALAEKQLRTLATNPGTQDASKAAYWTVSAQDPGAFTEVARELAGTLVDVIATAKKGQLPTVAAGTPPPAATPPAVAPTPGPTQPAQAVARTLSHAALVQYLGRATEPQAPRDVVAWVVDRDLLDPALVSLEPRLLINRRELNDLRRVLQDVMTAGRQSQLSGKDLFTALSSGICCAYRGQSRIRREQTMAELVPEFLQGLPYKSPLMTLSNSLWASWSQEQQDEFLEGIEAKIPLYQTILDASDQWVRLHTGDALDEYVYPLALEALP
jgi:serine/threonine-protein kinase PpkA